MCNTKECITLITDNLPYIQRMYGVTGLCLFGSMARGDNRPDSDVDMPPKILLMEGLRSFLENLLKTSVDLVRRHAHLSQKLLNQIASDAITIL